MNNTRQLLHRLLLLGGFSVLTSLLFAQDTAKLFLDFEHNPVSSILPDFSYAGYEYGEKEIPVVDKNIYNVLKYGVSSNSSADQTQAIQALIDKVGKRGGGVIYFPKGKYYLNMDSTHHQSLKINYNNIILRGDGSGEGGTILYSKYPLTQHEVSPWLSLAVIQTATTTQKTTAFWGLDFLDTSNVGAAISTLAGKASDAIQAASVVAHVSKDAKKGQRVINVTSTRHLAAGSVIILGMYNTTDDGNLIKDILQPTETFDSFERSALDAGKSGAPSYQWLVEVDKVLSATSLQLKQPLRRDILMKYKPVIAAAPMLSGIGIEHLRLESGWSGYYCHHGCNKAIPAEGREMDYGWTAINLCRVKHSWINDVAIHNFTNPIYFLDSRNCTAENINISGYDGHSGIKIYSHAADNLITNVHFYNNYTHVLSGEGCAYGNVFSNIIYTPSDSKPGNFDFHGFADRRFSPAGYNLFENIVGLQQTASGGAPNNLPQTAGSNTWWNVEEGSFEPNNNEFFSCWVWKNKDNFHEPKEHLKMYPKSILLGVYSPTSKIKISGGESDVQNEWIYTENFNRGRVLPASLHEAQLKLRLGK